MAITTTTISKSAGWARTDVIVQLEEAFTWLGWNGETQTGIVTGISAYSGGGSVTSQVGLFDYYVYDDVPVSTTSGIGTGASFSVRRYNGSVDTIYVNRPGVGYTNGEYVTINTGGTGATAIGVTVSVLGASSPTGVGSTTTFYSKDITPGSSYPWGVMRHVIQPNKKFGTTYRGFTISGNTLLMATGSGFHPHTVTNTSNGGNGYATRFAGERGLDLYTTIGNGSLVPGTTEVRYNSSSTYPAGTSVSGTYASSTSYQLDLNIFRSAIDPNFAVISFRHPTLSSTHLAGNTYFTFIVHNFTTSIWDLDDLFLGGTTIISPDTVNSGSPYLNFTTILEGLSGAKRSAEWGYSRSYTNKTTRYYSTVYPTFDSTTISNPNFYYRENTSISGRGTGGPTNNYVYLPSSTNYNAIMKGIPLNTNMVPCPYYIPDDFVLIDFDYATPSANIQQGDTITISGSEVYTVITGSYNQTTRTRGILFCARTV